MATLQSPRHRQTQNRWRKFNADAAAVQRRTEARSAAIRTLPPPAYIDHLPQGLPLQGEFLAARINGALTVITLGTPAHSGRRRGRVDQRCAWLDGKLIAEATGLTELCTALRQSLPKAQPIRALACEQQAYTETDEADAAES